MISEFDTTPQAPQQLIPTQFTGANICNTLGGQQQTGIISDAKITLVDNYFQQTQNIQPFDELAGPKTA